LIAKSLNLVINYRFLQEEYLWLIFNIIQSIESVLFPVCYFFIANKKHTNLRIIFLASAIFNSFSSIQYLITYLSPACYPLTILFFMLFVIPLVYRYVIESILPESHNYSIYECFLAYKRPKSITGSICALITVPYGHCSLIVKGKEFTFKNGKIIEREIKNINKLTFTKIPIVNIHEARKLIGVKWSLKNNCFAVFNRFKNCESM